MMTMSCQMIAIIVSMNYLVIQNQNQNLNTLTLIMTSRIRYIDDPIEHDFRVLQELSKLKGLQDPKLFGFDNIKRMDSQQLLNHARVMAHIEVIPRSIEPEPVSVSTSESLPELQILEAKLQCLQLQIQIAELKAKQTKVERKDKPKPKMVYLQPQEAEEDYSLYLQELLSLQETTGTSAIPVNWDEAYQTTDESESQSEEDIDSSESESIQEDTDLEIDNIAEQPNNVHAIRSSSTQYVTATFTFNGYSPYDICCLYDTGCTLLLAKENVFPPEYWTDGPPNTLTYADQSSSVTNPHNEYSAVYIDDIIVFSRTKDAHYVHLKKIAETLRDNGIIVSKRKAEFCKTKIEFLGCEIFEGQIILQPHVLTKLVDFPEEIKKKQELQTFLGLINYAASHYLPGIAELKLPLQRKLREMASSASSSFSKESDEISILEMKRQIALLEIEISEKKAKLKEAEPVKQAQIKARLQDKPFNLLDELNRQSDQIAFNNPPNFRPSKPNPKDDEKSLDLNQKKIKPWKPSAQRPLSKDQLELLTLVFNHVKQGTGSPNPVRQVETEFSRLNKIIQEKKAQESNFEAVIYSSEIDLKLANLEMLVQWKFLQAQVCPLFFTKYNRWHKIHEALKSKDWEYVLLHCYSEEMKEAFRTHKPLSGSANQAIIKFLFKENLIRICSLSY
ncbi:hypothetical protein HHK36_001142 [Tetracentron sinense]|uniref:Reverse transcriptase domain-containing protein n=1 Tax=Tetracentron sinense TaxID=13715 RepID=A0A835A2A4_TETSI|nr:hypothetical protein HHK36_001142 [Tetracentron sinense]